MNLSEKSPHEIEHARPEATPQALNLLQPVEIVPSATVAGNGSRTRSGLRVMRTSPVILVACGIVFASLIFLLDLRAQTETHAGQETGVSRTASNNPAKSQSVPAAMRQETVQTNAPTATPSPSATPAPAQAESPASASQNNDEELARKLPAPAAGQPVSEVKASTVEASGAEPSADEGNYTLQVGSFNDLAEASERVAKLGSLGITAYVARVEIPKRGIWYRVQTGSFRSREEAARYGAQLRSRGSVADFIITERRAS
jgi:cell division protein FtsN